MSLTPVTLSVVTDDGLRTPTLGNIHGDSTGHGLMPHGYSSVAAMLSAPVILSAHRGGSVEWPEHSMRAYTQAVYEGYGCLEWSTQRTSDGVYVGCHDPNINAVTHGGNFGLPDIKDMTWAQIQQYQVKAPSGHPERGPRPFARLDELVSAYGGSHVIMIDPKNIGSAYYNELLDFMDDHGGPTRWMCKWVGGNSAWSTAFRNRGYLGWGAYYNTDSQASVTASQGQWDILGFNYGASQAEWDFILSFGKRVLAHVVPTLAAAQEALSKGATGLQVSGTESVPSTILP